MGRERVIFLPTAEDTRLFGYELTRNNSPNPRIITLQGDLGAGKTTFVQGLAQGLGISQTVQSPTFTYLQIYEGDRPLYHFDLYRLKAESDFVLLGFEEYFEADGVVVIEWPERIASLIPASAGRITLAYKDSGRTLSHQLWGEKLIHFTQGKYLLSALTADQFPQIKNPQGKILPEIALVGRSNAGKSSFINALLQTKTLAKTSSTPGKTQRVNFFLIDEALLLVDLPGYGFAKAPQTEVRQWSSAIDEYLNNRTSLRMVILILDIRREISKEDLMMAEWASSKNISLFVIFTKRDKLSNTEAEESIRKNLALLGNLSLAGFLAVSNTDFYERRGLIQKLNKEMAQWV